MADLELQLNPLSKLHIYQEARKLMFHKMDANKVSPERTDEVLDYVEKEVVKVGTPEQAKAFAQQLSQKFPELAELEKEFTLEYEQKLDMVIQDLIVSIMEKGDMEFAAKVMDEVNAMKNKKDGVQKIASDFPEDFQKSLQKFTK